jgi:starch synthase
MRYGALPLARKTGGLADTIVDISTETLEDGTGTGFLFFDPDTWHLGEAITRAVAMYNDEPEAWDKAQKQAMAQQFTWAGSAKQYVNLYKSLVDY